jgi:hypothetical protein
MAGTAGLCSAELSKRRASDNDTSGPRAYRIPDLLSSPKYLPIYRISVSIDSSQGSSAHYSRSRAKQLTIFIKLSPAQRRQPSQIEASRWLVQFPLRHR